jgi:hypothetical protein
MRQEGILLRLVEPVHLVDEQQCALARLEARLGLGEHAAHLGQARHDRRHRLEARLRIARQQQRQRGLAATRRAPQHHRMQTPGLHRTPERAALGH